MSVCIVSSKTDQYQQGDTVLVARTSSPTCPLAMMGSYFSQARLSHSLSLLPFRGITHTNHGKKLRSTGGLSYMVRELFVTRLRELGFDTKQFELHSLQAGGATAAANAGVPDRLFKEHSRWQSE